MANTCDPRRLIAGGLLLTALTAVAHAAAFCPFEQSAEQIPTTQANLDRCEQLDPIVRKPTPGQLDQYETHLSEFFNLFCHRRLDKGWTRDETVRDAGPFVATLSHDGSWTGKGLGTHAPVLVWYSPEMVAWLRANRPDDGTAAPANPPPPPDGAIMVKEMYGGYKDEKGNTISIPASACRVPDLLRLRPTENGAAIMVRDSAASRDGWFWGWYGWPKTSGAPNTDWNVDWPPPSGNPLPTMGFGQYCLNCHASAVNNMTFASLSNVQGGKPGRFLPFLSQDASLTQRFGGSEQGAGSPTDILETRHTLPLGQLFFRLQPLTPAPEFTALLGLSAAGPVPPMPSQTYDNVWMPGQTAPEHGEFVTSDQCVGCHTAGGTGLAFDMTVPAPAATGKPPLPPPLYNFSPYGTWRSSPMGLSGRDPIFFAQLASETKTFHPAAAASVENTCLACHGVQGQRQFHIAPDAQSPAPGNCADPFRRDVLDETPYPSGTGQARHFDLGALARDGVSCTACHRMEVGPAGNGALPQNRCIAEQQRAFNQDKHGKLFTGFAATFTGNFFVGPADRMYGPFEKPRPASMKHALGVTPEHNAAIQSAELCGACHTLHLPVLVNDKQIGRSYEQTTYPEWAFSDYRLGETAYGALPFGKGSLAKSCQDCHMPKAAANGEPFQSKIAGIQEHDSFPAVENGLPGTDIDLPTRSGFAKHRLVGLNVFLMEIAAQFPDALGIPEIDPMLGKMGVPPAKLTEQAMLDQAADGTADIAVSGLTQDGDNLVARVTVTNKSGHKFPSGVGFRRAFVDFAVLGADGAPLWESGRTNGVGELVDEAGNPIDGELWWTKNCGERLNRPGDNHYQPHYREITRQDQAQVFQELVTAPPPGDGPSVCGHDADPNANAGALTTSFLSICAKLKDNRLLPRGFLPLAQRIEIAKSLGADDELALDAGSAGAGDDPAYADALPASGSVAFTYRVPAAALNGKQPAKVSATLYYQATPPFYLQDRFCTGGGGDDQRRLQFLTGYLRLTGNRVANWKLKMVSTGEVPLPAR